MEMPLPKIAAATSSASPLLNSAWQEDEGLSPGDFSLASNSKRVPTPAWSSEGAQPGATLSKSRCGTHRDTIQAVAGMLGEEGQVESMENSLSCNGADARYVGIVNERAFSALQMRGGGAGIFPESTRVSYGFSRFPPQLRQHGESATSATLTPMRASRAGTPSPPHLHTPLHSTAYGSQCYNRLLSSALLGGSEGRRSGVFSLPAWCTPPAKVMQSAGATKVSASSAPAADQTATPCDISGSSALARHAGLPDTVAFSFSDAAGLREEADSVLVSLCPSPPQFPLGDGREDGEDAEAAGSSLPYTRLFCPSALQLRTSEQLDSGHGCPAVSMNGQTPSVTSPLSYFQHAPPVWGTTRSPALRLCFHEGSDGADICDSTSDAAATSTPNAWQSSPTVLCLPMRTAGVVPHAPFSVLPPAMGGSAPGPYRMNDSADLTGAVHGSSPFATPSHAVCRAADMGMTLRWTYSMPAEMDDTAPSSPLYLFSSSSSTSRPHGFSGSPVSRPTFIKLPSASAPHAYPSAMGGGGTTAAASASDCVAGSRCAALVGCTTYNGGGSCATPVPFFTDDSPTTTRSIESGESAAQVDALLHSHSTPSRSLFAEPLPLRDSVGAAECSTGVHSDAKRRSLRSSPASVGRPLVSSRVLSTPVRHHDNSIRVSPGSNRHRNSGLNVGGGASGSLSVSSPFPTSPASRFAVSPIGAATPVSLSPARQSMRYGPLSGAAATAAAVADASSGAGAASVMPGLLRMASPYRDAFLAGPRNAADTHRRGNMNGRDTFHFVRAMAASATSTNPLHSPFYWGCFGVLVAQGAEVWCVGKAQPFRMYPHELDSAPRVHGRETTATATTTTITAVAATATLSAATWEDAVMTGGNPVATVAAAAAAAGVAQNIAYLAVGTSVGDVVVYAYGKCSASAPGAVVVSPSSPGPSQAPPQQHQPTCAVKLQQLGTLRCADRIGDDRQPCAAEEGEQAGSRYRSAFASLRSRGEAPSHAISVCRVVGPWLYVGDQSGHVSRYDLRHTSFLHEANETTPIAARATVAAGAQQQERASTGSPMLPSRAVVEERSGTPARVVMPPKPCMPVHHFARPSPTPMLKAAPKPSVATPTGAPQQGMPTSFHFAVHAGEPVHNLEVTDNHAYLAVGTLTRLLVYRVAEMPRVADARVSEVSLAVSCQAGRYSGDATQASTPPLQASEAARCSVADFPVEPTSPIVVVSDAPQPVRCFAWMLCDYEMLGSVKANVMWGDDAQSPSAAPDGEKAEHNAAASAATGLRADVADFRTFSSVLHTPVPSLVFAYACHNTTDVAAVFAGASGHEGGAPPQLCLRTQLQLYRVVTNSVVASCTLDYPVHAVKVVPGTTHIIVGTGSTADWQQRHPLTPERTSLTDTPLARAHAAPTPLPLPGYSTQARSQSAATAVADTTTPNPTRSPTPARQHRFSSPAAAAVAMAALRTLAGDDPRSSPGFWYAAPQSSSFAAAFRPNTRLGSTSMRQHSREGQAAHAMTPVTNTASHRSSAGMPGNGEHGFLFCFEVCACAVDGADGDEEGGGCVCLRARGEVAVGEGESVVSAFLSPCQNQVAVLVQPTSGHHRRADATSALSVKVKVWGLTWGSRSGPASYSPHVASFNANAPTMESLR
jgi:hypothetical protein